MREIAAVGILKKKHRISGHYRSSLCRVLTKLLIVDSFR